MSTREPGGLLQKAGGLSLHPVALAATLLLWQNDHDWKWRCPGWLTGKLSDVCGMVMFPLLLVGLAELVLLVVARPRTFGWRAVAGAAVATGVVFAAIKVSESAANVYRFAFGVRWMLEEAVLHGRATLPSVQQVVDPTDLLALPALVVPVLIAWRARDQRVGSQLESA